MDNYVAGFLFSNIVHTNGKPERWLALIEKNKPDWQKGKLNAIGGKIEDGETPLEAQIREFKEEAGVIVPNWRHFCRYHYQHCIIHFFMAIGDIRGLSSQTDEKIRLVKINLTTNTLDHEYHIGPMIPNLHWLIPLALDNGPAQADVLDLS